MDNFYSWLATLSFIQMVILSIVVIVSIVGGYYWLCRAMEKKAEIEAEGERFNPEWMDYDKWFNTKMDDFF